MSIELKRMTPSRAAYFMERFKREEKLLGPNEQAALTYVIDMLEKATAIQQAEAQQPATPASVQADSSEHLRVIASLGAALRRLSFAAQTTGGTDGPDAELQSAIGQAEQALSLGGIWQAMSATGETVADVRCEGCGYMTRHREHMGCVRAAKQHTHPAASVPDGLQWFTVAEHGLPEVGEVVVGGLWYTDPWLKPECATSFMWGQCRVVDTKHRDFKDGKQWLTFGPSHNQITHWARLNPPSILAAKEAP